jgi:hypothetical protein
MASLPTTTTHTSIYNLVDSTVSYHRPVLPMASSTVAKVVPSSCCMIASYSLDITRRLYVVGGSTPSKRPETVF